MEVIILPVNKEGVIDIVALKDALNERTVVVSVMHVNNEVGTIQPLREIKFMIDAFRKGLPGADDANPTYIRSFIPTPRNPFRICIATPNCLAWT